MDREYGNQKKRAQQCEGPEVKNSGLNGRGVDRIQSRGGDREISISDVVQRMEAGDIEKGRELKNCNHKKERSYSSASTTRIGF